MLTKKKCSRLEKDEIKEDKSRIKATIKRKHSKESGKQK